MISFDIAYLSYLFVLRYSHSLLMFKCLKSSFIQSKVTWNMNTRNHALFKYFAHAEKGFSISSIVAVRLPNEYLNSERFYTNILIIAKQTYEVSIMITVHLPNKYFEGGRPDTDSFGRFKANICS